MPPSEPCWTPLSALAAAGHMSQHVSVDDVAAACSCCCCRRSFGVSECKPAPARERRRRGGEAERPAISAPADVLTGIACHENWRQADSSCDRVCVWRSFSRAHHGPPQGETSCGEAEDPQQEKCFPDRGPCGQTPPAGPQALEGVSSSLMFTPCSPVFCFSASPCSTLGLITVEQTL